MVFTNGIGAACAATAQSQTFDVFLVEIAQLIVKLLAAAGTVWAALMELVHLIHSSKDTAHG